MRVVDANRWTVGRSCLRLGWALATYTCLFTPAASGAAGGLDPRFGVQGRSIESTLPAARAIVASDDGGFVVAGAERGTKGSIERLIFSRYSATGQLDPTFSEDGAFSFRAFPATPRLQIGNLGIRELETGEIAATGELRKGATRRLVAVRLLPNGGRDPSFGGGDGVLELGDGVKDAEFDPQGRLVSLGDRSIRRELPTGEPDPSFSDDGEAEIPTGFENAVHAELALAPGGSILVSRTGPFRFVRLRSDGTLDPSFGSGGVSEPVVAPYASAHLEDVVVGPDDSTYFLATFVSSLAVVDRVVKLDADGVLSTDFGDQGDGTQPIFSSEKLALDAAGRIVVLEYFYAGGMAAQRLGPDGSFDLDFGVGGRTRVYFGLNDAGGVDLAVAPDGAVVLAGGITAPGGATSQALARLLPDDGPEDADADGVLDERDQCRFVAGNGVRGCPLDRRQLTIKRFRGDSLQGSVFAATAECATARIYLFRQLRYSDRRQRRIDPRGYMPPSHWRSPRLRPGKYHVETFAEVASGRARCSPARSHWITIR